MKLVGGLLFLTHPVCVYTLDQIGHGSLRPDLWGRTACLRSTADMQHFIGRSVLIGNG